MSDLWTAVEVATGHDAIDDVVAAIPAVGQGKNIERLLTLSKLYTTLFVDDEARRVGEFIANAETAILERADFVSSLTDLTSHVTLLRKVARRPIRKPRSKIFTTNYDLTLETAAQKLGFVVVDGFSHTLPQTYDRSHFAYDLVRRTQEDAAPNYVENVFHLHKLHGSIDWKRDPAGKILRSKEAEDGAPVLIYPRDTKFQESYEAPYLDMMAAFQASLREPDTTLIVSGYGFHDDHISKPIMAAIEANLSLRVVVCDISFLNDHLLSAYATRVPDGKVELDELNAFHQRLLKMAQLGDNRICLLNGRFEDLVLALPDLVAQTDRERHAERMALSQR